MIIRMVWADTLDALKRMPDFLLILVIIVIRFIIFLSSQVFALRQMTWSLKELPSVWRVAVVVEMFGFSALLRVYCRLLVVRAVFDAGKYAGFKACGIISEIESFDELILFINRVRCIRFEKEIEFGRIYVADMGHGCRNRGCDL